MSDFSVRLVAKDAGALCLLQGKIDEDAIFEAIDWSKYKTVVFDFDGVTAINSKGIQKWIVFFTSFPADRQTTFSRCRVCVVHQLNLFPSFTAGKQVRIASFYAPYFGPTEDKNYEILLDAETVRAAGFKAPAQKSPDGQHALEFDALEKKYFLFLSRAP